MMINKIFGIGLSRTGTTSLAEALNLLGIKTIHFPSDLKTFEELKSGNYRLSILETYQGATDISVAPFYAQLDKIYPNSKFILTVRDPDSWISSVEKHWNLAQRWTGGAYPFIEFIRAAVYGTVQFQEHRFRFVYETHCRNVREHFENRPEDFLMMDICNGDGWEKLCPFLGLSPPDQPFPNRNQASGNRQWAEALDSAAASLQAHFPSGLRVALIGSGKLGINIPEVLPVENRNGIDWGSPSDDQEAIREVEELRGKGVRHLVFFFPFFWWFDYYHDWNRYINLHSHCIARTDQLIILELH